ncbi:MAG: hypothetical protein D6725_00010 [Planctomycetota bacterium]|nr:MAG: hypothetical protein D6725_00010 [Planctomycetota bacterium]
MAVPIGGGPARHGGRCVAQHRGSTSTMRNHAIGGALIVLFLAGLAAVLPPPATVAEPAEKAGADERGPHRTQSRDAIPRTAAEPAVAGWELDRAVRAPEGFRVQSFAGDALAHDVFCMTVDARGRVVVSGPGYVKILSDDDGDGRADRAIRFADGPRTGAQGMCFDGPDLLAIGDWGLLRFRDRDGDDRADGPPEVLLKLKCGGEHHAHGVRRGPDGWWYVIAGNMTEVDAAYVTLPESPIRDPRAGVLLRLSPDFRQCEVVAHGFRNAYDFDFAPAGEIFAYDSDGERDVSLPWYRPTRVFHVLPGSDAGWVSRSWKHPDDFFEMPPVLTALGRGSPTGVLVYRHDRFPREYRDAVFVCDWTFGRVVAIPRVRVGSTWAGQPRTFLRAGGTYGFAPTDLAVGVDGSLYVSVGGRGTQGGVFRVRWEGGRSAAARSTAPAERHDGRTRAAGGVSTDGVARPAEGENERARMLAACLAAPQPLAAWSRARWRPLARRLGASVFAHAAADQSRSAAERVRALEILAELFGGADAELVDRLGRSDDAAVRAAAIWAFTPRIVRERRPELIRRFLTDGDPHVVRRTLETLLRFAPGTLGREYVTGLLEAAGASDRYVRQLAARVLARLSDDAWRVASADAESRGRACALTMAWAETRRSAGLDSRRVRRTWALVEKLLPRSAVPDEQRGDELQLALDGLRLLQVELGDIGIPRGVAPVFAGYVARRGRIPRDESLDRLAAVVADRFPTGIRRIDEELSRIGAMLGVEQPRWLDAVLARVTPSSDPLSDVHYLIVAARCGTRRTETHTAAVADALLSLQGKIDRLRRHQDNNWDDRMGELYRELARRDPALHAAVARHPKLGHPQHTVFVRHLPKQWLPVATDAFARRAAEDEEGYGWNPEVVFLLGRSGRPEHRAMVRRQFDRPGLRNAVLLVLAESPEPGDRARLVQGLQSFDTNVVAACVRALQTLGPGNDPRELAFCVRALRGLSAGKTSAIAERLWQLVRSHRWAARIPAELLPQGLPQRDAVERLAQWLAAECPQVAPILSGGVTGERLSELEERLRNVPWQSGDIERGARLYRRLGCAQCHEGGRAVGPSLAGVARRFSRRDLFVAVAFPNRDVSPRYQTTRIVTTDGKLITGVVVYESVDGLILRDGAGRTYRVEAEQIEARSVLPVSLMPRGLLERMGPQEAADLYAFLQTL